MALRDYLLSALGGVRAPAPRAEGTTMHIGDLNDPVIQEFLRGGSATNSGAVVTTDGAMRVGAGWRCTHIICGSVGNLPLDIMRRVDEKIREPAEDHAVRKVLTVKPNSWQTPAEFKKQLQAHLVLRGNGYALKVKSLGRLIALIPMHPDRVEVKQNDDLSLSYVYTRANGRQIPLKREDVFHLRGLSLDGVTGLSLIGYAREAFGLAMQTEQAGARLFKQGTLVGGALTHPQKLSTEAYDRLKTSLEEKYAGVENAHKIIILEEGMEPKSIGMSATDAQFLATRDFQRYDIAMFYGVPPHMLGATEKTTSWGSGIEQMSTGFVQYTLQDWLTTWEEAINRDLLEHEPNIYAKFFTAGLLRGDVKTRTAHYVSMMQWGVYSPNEVRALEDVNPREGGDVYYDPPNTAGDAGAALAEDDPEEEDDDRSRAA